MGAPSKTDTHSPLTPEGDNPAVQLRVPPVQPPHTKSSLPKWMKSGSLSLFPPRSHPSTLGTDQRLQGCPPKGSLQGPFQGWSWAHIQIRPTHPYPAALLYPKVSVTIMRGP